jgi:hypothetical protein
MSSTSQILPIVLAISAVVGLASCGSKEIRIGSDPNDEVAIVSLQAEFHTQDDDKDEGDGISETLTYNTKVIGENRSYLNNVRFRENTQNTGQLFVLSKDNQVPLSDIGAVTYRYIMDNDDGWKVLIRIKARDNHGNEHLVAEERREIGEGKPRQGMIQLRVRP